MLTSMSLPLLIFKENLLPTLCTRQRKRHWCIEQSYGFWERERVGRFGRMALKHAKYHVWNELPVQVQCTILDVWGWCTGTTQRDGMGREEGGGFRMGNTCIPVADSFWYLARLIQLCKVKKNKIKKNKENLTRFIKYLHRKGPLFFASLFFFPFIWAVKHSNSLNWEWE